MKKYTIEEIKKYLKFQDSFGDALYNLSEKNIDKANDNVSEEKLDIIRLEQTCTACPEQYDANIGDEYVGYLSLRHGCFSVKNANGLKIYSGYPIGDGVFDSSEREYYLTEAKKAILLDIKK